VSTPHGTVSTPQATAAEQASGTVNQCRHIGYNRLVDHVGIHDQRRLTEALCKGSLVRRKEYLTESSPQAK
ncbi:hypothetical protein Taro_046132, partial [Colocasia esculenta]|nr:hypothetical protein [Colocasia esculenta]